MVAQDEDGQHLETISAHAVADHKPGIGRAGEHVQALLDMDDDAISEMISYYLDQVKLDPPNDCGCLPLLPYGTQELTELYEQLALYRIRGYQVISHHMNRVKTATLISQSYMLDKRHGGWSYVLSSAQALCCV